LGGVLLSTKDQFIVDYVKQIAALLIEPLLLSSDHKDKRRFNRLFSQYLADESKNNSILVTYTRLQNN